MGIFIFVRKARKCTDSKNQVVHLQNAVAPRQSAPGIPLALFRWMQAMFGVRK